MSGRVSMLLRACRLAFGQLLRARIRLSLGRVGGRRTLARTARVWANVRRALAVFGFVRRRSNA
eukprot:9298821-Lingulodinium_polyedra.AAC.1